MHIYTMITGNLQDDFKEAKKEEVQKPRMLKTKKKENVIKSGPEISNQEGDGQGKQKNLTFTAVSSLSELKSSGKKLSK